jgi:four helix bundle protein
MTSEELKKRTKAFGVRVIRLVDLLPESRTTNIIARQIVRSGTSVGANYRAACRAKSRPDFVNKLRIVEEECDETLYWMELLIDAGKAKVSLLADLMKEADELVAIMVASINTARNAVNRQSAIGNRQFR